jgi:aspartate/methionine/tyrosine aminotransferase
VRGFDPGPQSFRYEVNENFGARSQRGGFRVPFLFAVHARTTFTESVIREMTRVAQCARRGEPRAGLSRLPHAPELLKEAAVRCDPAATSTSTRSPGARPASAGDRGEVRATLRHAGGPEREITVTCGATEAMASVMLALIDPGDEVIVLEPFYENYGPDAILSGEAGVRHARAAGLAARPDGCARRS